MCDEENVLYGPRDDQPLPDMPVGHFLLQQLKQHGNKIAQVFPDTDETFTFADIVTRAVSVAEELQARGLKLGDVIVLITTVSSDFAPLFVGGLLAGVVIAPLSPGFDDRDIKAMLTLYQPKIIFCHSRSGPSVEKIIPDLNSHPEVIQFESGTTWKKFLLREPNSDYHPVDIPDFWNREAVIMSSSGTTGLPKGVMLTHKNILSQLIISLSSKIRLTQEDDTVLQLSPVFWISGLFLQLLSMVSGAKLVVLPNFTGEKILKTIEDYKVRVVFVSPNLLAMLSATPSAHQYDLSSLRSVICSGASMSSERQATYEAILKLKVNQFYATTEGLLTVGFTLGDTAILGKPGSSGKLRPNVKAKVVDIETGKPLGAMQRGELWLSAPSVTKGYYRNPEATANTIDEHGWLHTGDVVYYDEDGCFYVVDRIKDLIKYKGIHVAPIEVESFLLEHPGVKEAAVVGIKHDLDQERPMAVVVRKPGSSVTEQELVDFVANNLAEHKWLRAGVLFVESLPKTTTGKIQRRILRNQLNQGV